MSKVKALVVDDSKIMRSQVKRALDQILIAEFEYEEAMDGEDALEKFNDDIDMLFVDWNMPKMTGVEFARAVRDQGYEDIPIIMVTAEKSMGKVDKALNEGGADEYITKPFTADKMHKAISKFFDENGELISQQQEEEKKASLAAFLNNKPLNNDYRTTKRATEIPTEIVEVVKESVINTFTSIAGDPPTYMIDEGEDAPLNGIIGNIAVFNPEFTFSLMLAIPAETAVNISEAFLGMELPVESDDMGDLIAELSNILAGDVAANMEKVGFRGQSSLPTATRGSDLRLFMPNKPPSSKLRFVGSIGDFVLNMALSESK